MEYQLIASGFINAKAQRGDRHDGIRPADTYIRKVLVAAEAALGLRLSSAPPTGQFDGGGGLIPR